MELVGHSALITGASSGIGAAIAERFARDGVRLGLVARREAELAEVAERCRALGADVSWWSVDLADLDATVRLAMRAEDELGGVDILVNNAGIPKRRTVLDLRFDEIDDVMHINYLSPVRLIKVILPRMLERGRGAIVNLSSVAARFSPGGEASYAASKAALTSFSEALAVEIWNTPVHVHVVNPAVIDTPLFQMPDNDPSYAPLDPLPTSAVSDAIVEQLRSGRFEIYVPAEFQQYADGRFRDIQGALAGSAAFYQSTLEQAAAAGGIAPGDGSAGA